MGKLNKPQLWPLLFLLLLLLHLFVLTKKANCFPFGPLERPLKNDMMAIDNIIIKNRPLILWKKILSDPFKKINEEFNVPKSFEEEFQFWFNIYTSYHSNQLVIHDRTHLSLVLEVIDLSLLNNSPQNPIKKKRFEHQLVKQRIDFWVKKLKSPKEAWRFQNITFKNKNQKTLYFKNLKNSLRVQRGQSDHLYDGIMRSLTLFPTIKSWQKEFEIPEEILGIPFLESSFNMQAKSKVGASGIWQFIIPTAQRILPMQEKSVDGRLSPLLSTLAAFHLIKQSYRLLKRWDLTVTAYNSGTKHLLLAKKKLGYLGKKNFSLENIFHHYKHPHLGFASQNFFIGFLAISYVLAYKNHIFPFMGQNDSSFPLGPSLFKVYLSLCEFIPNKFILSESSQQTKLLSIVNQHLLNPNNNYPPGTIFFSSAPLPSHQFYLLSQAELRQYFPKNWKLLTHFLKAKNQSCSTK